MSFAFRLFACLAVVLLSACGSTSAASGTNNVPGGKPGNPCNAATAPIGCYAPGDGTSQIVNCPADVSPAAWQAGQACGAGTHCAVKTKTEAECVANPVVTPVNDTVSGGGSDTSGGSKGDSSAAEECVKAKCAAETNACMTNLKCTNFLACLSKCPDNDKTCQDGCAAPIQGDAAATKVVQDFFQCSISAGMACAGLGGDDATSGDAGIP